MAQKVEHLIANLFELEAEVHQNLGGHAFRAPRGCGECNHTGYSGRTGVYEFLEMRGPLIDALAHGEPSVFVHAAREQMGGATLRRDAVLLATQGRTTIDEAMRVSAQVDE